jgi:fructose-1,6-bisphosphatase/inositol monophosphatase family enzyme
VLQAGHLVEEHYRHSSKQGEGKIDKSISSATHIERSSPLFTQKPPAPQYKDEEKHQLVTFTDTAADKVIREVMKQHGGNCAIISEEGEQVYFFPKATADRKDVSRSVFVVDPLDGTSNFAMGAPYFAVSIANVDYETGRTKEAVVFNPLTRELYLAKQDCGAYLISPCEMPAAKSDFNQFNVQQLMRDAKPLQCSTKPDLKGAIIDTEFSSDVEYLRFISSLVEVGVKKARQFSSAILSGVTICKSPLETAAALHGFYDKKLKLWDMASVSLFIKESGGEIYYISPEGVSDIVAYQKHTMHKYLKSASKEDFVKIVKEEVGGMIAGGNQAFTIAFVECILQSRVAAQPLSSPTPII